MSKILTITVPSYNTEKYMDECLPTLLDSRINNRLEIIMVNDGSKDNTLQKAREYEEKYPLTIRVIDKENGGHGSTINKGIELATGKYFKVVDGDDWVNTDELVKLVDALEELEADIVISPYEDHNVDTGVITKQDFIVNNNSESISYDELVGQANRLPMMHATTFKTSVLRDNGIKIDENCFYVDMEYIIFPMLYLKTATYVNATVYCYRMGTAEQSVNPANFIKNRHMHKKVTKELLKTYVTLKREQPQAERTRILGKLLQNMEINLDTNIHLTMDDTRLAKEELMQYYTEIREIDKEILQQVSGKKVALLTKFNGLLFPIVSFLMKKSNKPIR
ncbi:TPA: glycosyltransferase family 2 protein [Streptococcus suis]